MLLNVGGEKAHAAIDIYFSDREPTKGITVHVPAERIIALRLDQPADLAGTVIPEQTQYALRITSDRNLVAQFGRLDTAQSNLAYYGSDGFTNRRNLVLVHRWLSVGEPGASPGFSRRRMHEPCLLHGGRWSDSPSSGGDSEKDQD